MAAWGYFQHSKIKFISPRGHVISSIYSNPFVALQSTISIHNSNFFEAQLNNFNIEVNWEDYVVANPDFPGDVKVKPRSTHNVCTYKGVFT